MVGLTLVGCAAAFYFLVYQPSTKAVNTSANKTVSVEPASAVSADTRAVTSDKPDQQSLPAVDVPRQAAAATASPSQVESTAKPESAGQYSLQAAAFPTSDGAGTFAEKLKRAGVPSYVVTADMGKRGTWFRVRVGRFESSDAARQYASEAQLRAKSAGISLQLIVCQYDQH